MAMRRAERSSTYGFRPTHLAERGLGDAGASRSCCATTKIAALVFAGAAPDAAVLVGGHRKLETLFAHRALGADFARLHEHAQRITGVADREEQFGIGVATLCVHPPRVVGGTKGEALCED